MIALCEGKPADVFLLLHAWTRTRYRGLAFCSLRTGFAVRLAPLYIKRDGVMKSTPKMPFVRAHHSLVCRVFVTVIPTQLQFLQHPARAAHLLVPFSCTRPRPLPTCIPCHARFRTADGPVRVHDDPGLLPLEYRVSLSRLCAVRKLHMLACRGGTGTLFTNTKFAHFRGSCFMNVTSFV